MPPSSRFRRGARPTPRHRIAEAVAIGRLLVHRPTAPPPQVAMVPRRLSMWLNDQDGDCVTAEEAWAIAAYSTYIGLPEIFIPDSSVLAFCNRFGVLNGADLLSVVQDMESTGLLGSDGTYYKDGTPSTVDYSNEAALQSAIAVGPVKIGIDANALPSGAGNQQGWSAFGGSPGQYSNEDHCVGLGGYGPVQWLAKQLGVTVPSGASNGYLVFTWSTIGIVDHAWIMSTCGEAYLRTPTTLGLKPPPPPPSDLSVSLGSKTGKVGAPVTFDCSIAGGSPPYYRKIKYGDGITGHSMTHTYAKVGTYGVHLGVSDSAGGWGDAMATATIKGTNGPTPTPTPTGLLAQIMQAIEDIIAGNPQAGPELLSIVMSLLTNTGVLNALVELLNPATQSQGWTDLLNALIKMLFAAKAAPLHVSPIVLQIVDAIIGAVGTMLGLPASLMAVLVQVINSLFGGQAAASFERTHSTLRRIPG